MSGEFIEVSQGYLKNLQASMRNTAAAAAGTFSTGTVSKVFPNLQVDGNVRLSSPPFLLCTSTSLEHDAYKTPVQTLLDLWTTRFGHDWVEVDMVNADPFFSAVCTRLRNLNLLEAHYLTDTHKYVCRRPE